MAHLPVILILCAAILAQGIAIFLVFTVIRRHARSRNKDAAKAEDE